MRLNGLQDNFKSHCLLRSRPYGERKTSTGLEDARSLGHRSLGSRKVKHSEIHDYGVKAAILK
jgi:hypothetical protein